MKSVKTIDILNYLNEVFQDYQMEDYSYNGLQFEGKPKVKKIVAGVDATLEFFDAAKKSNADFAIVHHGLFWKGGEWSRLDRLNKRIFKALDEIDLNLYASHLPLDAHKEFGNNVCIARELGLTITGPFAVTKGYPIGYIAKTAKPIKLAEFKALAESKIGKIITELDFGKDTVSNIAIVSGGGGSYVKDPAIYDGKADLLLTGEIIHQQVAMCREREVNMLSLGHYATEIFGVKALTQHVAEKFKLEYEFIDLPTGL